MAERRPIALTIAGSDSGGGAGIQADLKTFHAHGVFGTSVLTAVTAQNTQGVTAVHAIPLDVVEAQIEAVVGDLRPDALKTGMLATSSLLETVSDAVKRHRLRPYVLDPVMVSTSGDRLLDVDAGTSLKRSLLPLATLITPNLHEAEILTGRAVRSLADMGEAARTMVGMGAGAALVKGGHLEGDAVDLYWDGVDERVWRRPRLNTRHTHGTGCTLSASITAWLARGVPLAEACENAVGWVARAIETAPELGGGHGPVNHFAPLG